jgi:hypothetical protein
MPVSLSNPRYTTRSSIAFAETGCPEELYADDQSSFVRLFQCLWSDRFAFTEDILGRDEYFSGAFLNRELPQEDFEFAGFYATDCRRTRILGVPIALSGDDYTSCLDRSVAKSGETLSPTDTSTWSDGLIEYAVTFRKPIYAVLDDTDVAADPLGELARFVIRTQEDSVETLQLPDRYLRFESDTQRRIDVNALAAGRPFPVTQLRYQWLRLPTNAVPENTIIDSEGKVNDAEFDGKPAGTLLMMAPQRRIYQAANWQTYVELIYTLAYRRTGWNKFLNPNTGEFERVVQVNDPTQSAYETANLSALFDPSAG